MLYFLLAMDTTAQQHNAGSNQAQDCPQGLTRPDRGQRPNGERASWVSVGTSGIVAGVSWKFIVADLLIVAA